MRRIVSRLCVLLFALASLTIGTAQPASASAAAIDGVTCSANYWSYYRHFNRPPVYSAPITCTPVGGVAPYTYSWQKTGGDGNIQATNQTSNSTSFTRGVANGGYWVSTFHLIVTDATGSVAVSPTVTVEFEWETGQ